MKCKYCGSKIEDEWNYCPYCMTQQKDEIDKEEIKQAIAEYKAGQEDKAETRTNGNTESNKKMSFDRAIFIIAIIVIVLTGISKVIISLFHLEGLKERVFSYWIVPEGVAICGIAALIMSKKEKTFLILAVILIALLIAEFALGFIIGALCGNIQCPG